MASPFRKKTRMYLDQSSGFQPAIDTIRTIKMKTTTAAVTGGTGLSFLGGTTPNSGYHFVFTQANVIQSDAANLEYVFYNGTAAAGTAIWQEVVPTGTSTLIDLQYSAMCTATDVFFDVLDTAGAAAGLTTHVFSGTGKQWTQSTQVPGEPFINNYVDTSGYFRPQPHPQECRVSGVINAQITAATGLQILANASGDTIQPRYIYIYHNEGADRVFKIYDGTVATADLVWTQVVPTGTATKIDLSSCSTCTDTGGIYIDCGDTTVNAFLPVISLGALQWAEEYP